VLVVEDDVESILMAVFQMRMSEHIVQHNGGVPQAMA
jgi:hypothetical protein